MAWHLFDQVHADTFREETQVLRQAAALHWRENTRFWSGRDIIELMRISRDLLDLFETRFKSPMNELVKDRQVGVVAKVPTATGHPQVTTSYDPQLLWDEDSLTEEDFWLIVMRTTNDISHGGLAPTKE
jgi:hypothetical protein